MIFLLFCPLLLSSFRLKKVSLTTDQVSARRRITGANTFQSMKSTLGVVRQSSQMGWQLGLLGIANLKYIHDIRNRVQITLLAQKGKHFLNTCITKFKPSYLDHERKYCVAAGSQFDLHISMTREQNMFFILYICHTICYVPAWCLPKYAKV